MPAKAGIALQLVRLRRGLRVERRAFVCLWQPSYFLFAWPRARRMRARTAKLARRAQGRMPGVKRKITNEKGHPAWRLPPIHGRQVREPGSGFRPDSCPAEKASASLPLPAARPVDPASPPHRGLGQNSEPSWPALGAQPLHGCESGRAEMQGCRIGAMVLLLWMSAIGGGFNRWMQHTESCHAKCEQHPPAIGSLVVWRPMRGRHRWNQGRGRGFLAGPSSTMAAPTMAASVKILSSAALPASLT
jgi:hypothetical protein